MIEMYTVYNKNTLYASSTFPCVRQCRALIHSRPHASNSESIATLGPEPLAVHDEEMRQRRHERRDTGKKSHGASDGHGFEHLSSEEGKPGGCDGSSESGCLGGRSNEGSRK